MRLKATLWKTITVSVASVLLSLPAQAERVEETPSAGAMVADAVVARPLYFALSQVGSVVYAATLPFTLLGNNADQAAESLVVAPLQGAFLRCLGCGKIDSQVDTLSTADGSKRINHFITLNGGLSMLDSANETTNTAGYGLYMGTHFALSDTSRFDVALGAKLLADTDVEDSTDTKLFSEEIRSYQLFSRFGRDLGAVDLMFKLGGHYWQADVEGLAPGEPSGKASGLGVLYGVGLDAWLTDSVRLGLDYTHYNMKKNSKDYDSKIQAVDLNLSFMF